MSTRKSKSIKNKTKKSKLGKIRGGNDFLNSLNKKEKNAVTVYQSGSLEINGFLRKGYSYFTAKEQKKIKGVLDTISILDSIFKKDTCPKTSGETILYRGTPAFYQGLNSAYTSCSKSIDALFKMKFEKRDTSILSFLSSSELCCINVLKVDENIPYLDLEHYSKEWEYQREVLLPRGLIATMEKEEIVEHVINGKFTYKFKTYTMRISMPGLPELPVDDRIPSKELKPKNEFLLQTQREEIIKIDKMFTEGSDYTDEKEDLSDLLDYLYNWSERGFTTTSQYKEISDKILNTLKKTLPGMIASDIVKEPCKKNIDEILEKVNSILESEEKLLAPTNYIQVKEC
jgi:hypothetical protein